MATVIFPETDDTATVAAWANMVDAVNRGDEDPLSASFVFAYGGGDVTVSAGADVGSQYIWSWAGPGLATWSDTTYATVIDSFTVAAGTQWLVEMMLNGECAVSDPGGNDASRLRLTAPAGGTWRGVIFAIERDGLSSTASGRFFSLSNGGTLVVPVDWRKNVNTGVSMPCHIVSVAIGNTTGGTIKVEGSHATNTRTTQTRVGDLSGNNFQGGVRILG